MQIRKTYDGINPDLLFDEIRDFVLKQGLVLGEKKIETYVLPTDSAKFIARGTMTFNAPGESDAPVQQGVRAHIVGSASGETKVMLDIDDKLFPPDKIAALQDDLDFIFGSYEVNPK
jgi:hypothetical protein